MESLVPQVRVRSLELSPEHLCGAGGRGEQEQWLRARLALLGQ